jgi:hypothetical protein
VESVLHRRSEVFFGGGAQEPTDDRQVSGVHENQGMSWESFAAWELDPLTMRGFGQIGALVRRRRHRLAISQRQLERLSGVDQSVISRLENGKLRGLRWSRFANLVGALGGLGEADPPPSWTRRSIAPGRRGIPS